MSNFLNTSNGKFGCMAVVDDYLMLQYLMVFAVSIFFTALAVERQTLLSTIVATLCWLVTALLSFIFAPTVIGSVMGYVFGVLAFVLAGAFLWSFISHTLDERHRRFEVGPL